MLLVLNCVVDSISLVHTLFLLRDAITGSGVIYPYLGDCCATRVIPCPSMSLEFPQVLPTPLLFGEM